MARVSARNTTILIKDSESASRVLSGRSNSATLNFTSQEVNVTSFGAEYQERVGDGIKDWSIECGGFWDGAASQLDEWLFGILAACTSACYGPGGSSTGAVQYSGCAILQDYTVEGTVDGGGVTWTATLVGASQLNRGSWA